MRLPRIAITMGDPAGIGPEICLRLLAEPWLRECCVPLIVGEMAILRRVAAHLQWTQEIPSSAVFDVPALPCDELEPGKVHAGTGRAAYTWVESAISLALEGKVDAVTTAPLHKEALHQAGINFPGHTEIFASRMSAPRSCMMQVSDEITCSFVTTHVGYAEVPALLTIKRLLDVLELSAEAVRSIRGEDRPLVVCGLNPHAGEHGLFGNGEEERIIEPAIAIARSRGMTLEGPLPPDTAFLPDRRKTTGCFICMYHDQGHIPLKALAFDRAVNTTLGLPIVRTSVDHGTALDLAWQGKANPRSLYEAVKLAARLAKPL